MIESPTGLGAVAVAFVMMLSGVVAAQGARDETGLPSQTIELHSSPVSLISHPRAIAERIEHAAGGRGIR